jgi:hypothetical protein
MSIIILLIIYFINFEKIQLISLKIFIKYFYLNIFKDSLVDQLSDTSNHKRNFDI